MERLQFCTFRSLINSFVLYVENITISYHLEVQFTQIVDIDKKKERSHGGGVWLGFVWCVYLYISNFVVIVSLYTNLLFIYYNNYVALEFLFFSN